jgi:hypothetical protein
MFAWIFSRQHRRAGKPEKRCKISGYPTKVLVSPGGKMLDLQLGAGNAAIRRAYGPACFKQRNEQQNLHQYQQQKGLTA